MGKLVKNYIYNIAYQLLTLITPVITAPYLARVLGAQRLGVYSYVSSSANIIITLSLLGLYLYGTRRVAYVRDNRSLLNRTFWELELAHLVLGTAGTLAYAVYAKLNPQYSQYFLLYYPYVLAQFIDCSWLLVGVEDMKPAALKNGAAKLINVAGIFILIKQASDLWIYILLLALTALLSNLSIYTQIRRYTDKPQGNWRAIPGHIRGSIALFLPQMASLFYLQVDKVMLQWMTGAMQQVSFYDQAEKIVTIPLSLITVISSVMMPRIANEFQKRNMDAIRSLLLRAARFSLCMALPMALGIACIAKGFVPWYLGSEYSATAAAIQVLSPIIVLNSLAGISGKQYFTATNQNGILLKAYFSAALLNVAVNALLIPRCGYIGAAIATVISSAASVTIQYCHLVRQIKLNGLLGYGTRYAVGAVIMAVGVIGIGHFMEASVKTTCFQLLTGIALYALYLIAIRDEVASDVKKTICRNLRKKTNWR